MLEKVEAHRLTPTDVAHRLRVSVDLIYKLVSSGELEAVQIG